MTYEQTREILIAMLKEKTVLIDMTKEHEKVFKPSKETRIRLERQRIALEKSIELIGKRIKKGKEKNENQMDQA